MTQSLEILHKAVELLEQGKSVAIATIISTKGSFPRKEGTRMLVSEDGEFWGTIGGGAVERNVLDLARSAIRDKRIIVEEFSSTKNNEQPNKMICGGRATVVIESYHPSKEILIFGAGHVGLAIYQIVHFLGFNVTVVDDRKEFATPERFPHAEKVIRKTFSASFKQTMVTKQTAIIVCTRRHDMDQACLEFALKTDAAYIGLLGSRSKWAQIKRNLKDKGFKPAEIRRVYCPIGLDIGAHTPEEIAVSVAAQLIQVGSST